MEQKTSLAVVILIGIVNILTKIVFHIDPEYIKNQLTSAKAVEPGPEVKSESPETVFNETPPPPRSEVTIDNTIISGENLNIPPPPTAETMYDVNGTMF